MVDYVLNERQESWITNSDGDILYNYIVSCFESNQKVNISFENIHGLNSSFVNSAFIQLLDMYSFEQIKNNLSFSNSNKQINQLILSRFKFEVEKKINKDNVAYV